MNIVVLFIILSVVNVITSTIRSIVTIKGNKYIASLVSAGYFAFYTVMLIYTVADFPLWEKCVITFATNLIGVFVVKLIEEKMKKDKLWKIEMTVNREDCEKVGNILTEMDIPYNWIDLEKWYIFNVYCATQKESAIVKDVVSKYNVKYFVSENKATL